MVGRFAGGGIVSLHLIDGARREMDQTAEPGKKDTHPARRNPPA